MSRSDSDDLVTALDVHLSDIRRAVSYRLVDPSDVSDVMQELWVKILTYPNSSSIRHPRAFLLRLAINLALDRLRRRWGDLQFRVDLDGMAEQLSIQANQEARLQAWQQLQLLNEAIDELPPKCRRVFLLHKRNHWSHQQIADHLGITRNMVEKHVMKALSHCRKRLDLTT